MARSAQLKTDVTNHVPVKVAQNRASLLVPSESSCPYRKRHTRGPPASSWCMVSQGCPRHQPRHIIIVPLLETGTLGVTDCAEKMCYRSPRMQSRMERTLAQLPSCPAAHLPLAASILSAERSTCGRAESSAGMWGGTWCHRASENASGRHRRRHSPHSMQWLGAVW